MLGLRLGRSARLRQRRPQGRRGGRDGGARGGSRSSGAAGASAYRRAQCVPLPSKLTTSPPAAHASATAPPPGASSASCGVPSAWPGPEGGGGGGGGGSDSDEGSVGAILDEHRLVVSSLLGDAATRSGALRDGDTVTLLVPELEEQGFRLPPEEQKPLKAAIAEAERGETMDGWQLLDDLKAW